MNQGDHPLARLAATAVTTFITSAGGALLAAISNGGEPDRLAIVAVLATGIVQAALTVQKYAQTPPGATPPVPPPPSGAPSVIIPP